MGRRSKYFKVRINLNHTHQFEQVVVNLAANSRDAMPGGGSFEIHTARCRLDERQATRIGLPPGPYVELRIVDSGEGMDEETRTHIFEPFFTTKEPGRGTGLGLSIVYSVVEQVAAVIMVAIVVGSEAAGMLGVVLAVPVTAAARNVFRYFYQEWSEPQVEDEPADPEEAAVEPS